MASALRYSNREIYFQELCKTSSEYILPYLENLSAISQNSKVLEIGCGEGGLLFPFACKGCDVIGIDISSKKIENANDFFKKRGQAGLFITENIFDEVSSLKEKTYDIIIVHDVIEHIESDKKLNFLKIIKNLLSDNGVVYMGFPAWHMPFGGHQQTCSGSITSKVPFTHLMPLKLYKSYLRLFGENEQQINELSSIYRSRITIERFEFLCKCAELNIIDRTLWFINPHYKAKFNLRPVKLSILLSSIPYIRNFFSTSCFYILKK